jgi:uncharacterized membrane protein
MMRRTLLNLAPWGLVLAMFLAAAAVWRYVPDSVPVHFGLNGEANRYGGKLEGVLSLPIVALGVLVLLKLAPRIDPLRARYAEFATTYALAILAIETCLALMYATILATILGASVNATTLIVALAGLLLIAIGAVLDHVRPNWFFGIRTPWTLSSERSWTATHRAGRWVLILMGLALVAAGLVQNVWLVCAAIATCAVGTVGLLVYSYLVWRADQRPSRI